MEERVAVVAVDGRTGHGGRGWEDCDLFELVAANSEVDSRFVLPRLLLFGLIGLYAQRSDSGTVLLASIV